jgi:lipoyl(octanoyl) transferase
MPEAESWRLIRTWDAPPGFNMGLDEALLRSPAARPVLRLYTWAPAALSLGYFQRHDEVVAALRLRAPDLPPLVRRLTGGGAIHHARELTFSIAAPLTHPLYRGPVAESYARVHAALADALARHGAGAGPRAERALLSDDPASPMCFHNSTALDLAWDGRKGVGSAQRRSGGRVLHHGSIKLGTTALEGAIATAAVSAQELGRSLAEALARRFGLAFDEEAPAEEELLHARAREGFFTSDAFLRRR